MQDSQIPSDTEITLVTKLTPKLLERGPIQRHGTLTVLLGTNIGAAFALHSQAMLIGRNPRAHVPLEDDGVSRSHARIVSRGDLSELEDLGSTNGTFLGGVRVQGRIPLPDGARIQIGNTLLRFALQDQIEWQASKQVYEASVRDALTGAFNRRYFEERLVSEFAFAARHGTALCVILADIDFFKRINDRFGHQAGDQVLRHIGAGLKASLRTEDMLARYGGEEFAVLARSIGVAGARTLAERLRSWVERTPVEWDGQQIPATISVGFSHNHSGAAASDPQRLVAAADKALYTAKSAGRNRIEIAVSPGRYVIHSDASELRPGRDARSRRWDKATAPQDDKDADLLPGIIQSPKQTPKS
jgi:diguanylate cyclase (GGDEF)-like protein